MTSETLAVIEQGEIRHQIDESRSALAEKIELLEEKVAETVQNATSSVAEATATVIDTVNHATASVSETVGNVNTAVQGTVENVRNSVSDTVESVKEAFDIPQQIRRHPWEMFAAAIAVGFVGGSYFVRGSTSGQNQSASGLRWNPRFENGKSERGEPSLIPAMHQGEPAGVESGSANTLASGSTITHYLRDVFGGELQKLQGLAIGVSLGLVRDFVAESAPTSLRPQIEEVINGFTEKLGGDRIRGPVLPPREPSNAT